MGIGSHIGIVIVDRGSGMDAELLARIGEPFFTTKAPGRGMGLGMFLARAVVEGVGGTLSLESAPGHGTTAQVTLPLSPIASSPSKGRPSKELAAAEPREAADALSASKPRPEQPSVLDVATSPGSEPP
jgi:Histidine kinase-, DNA gyrase B-, and HSP90-like ATPase